MKDHAFATRFVVHGQSFIEQVSKLSAFVLIVVSSALATSRAFAQEASGFVVNEYQYSTNEIFSADAAAALPTCLGGNGILDVNNEQVIQWKKTSPNQFHGRGHIQGRITRIFPDATGHDHFEVTVGQDAEDTIEVIYNGDFGNLPQLSIGQTAEACGDYITSNARVGGYPESPDGAILHWVHLSTNNHHPSGYIAIDGVPYGVGKQKHVPPTKGKERR